MYRKVELVVLALLLIGLMAASKNLQRYVSGENVKKGKTIVALDAGHGGDDPGKIGVNNAEEKEINLRIAEQVKTLLEEEEIEVLMTREDDTMLAKETDTNKKVQDMKARVQKINEAAPALVVSIHQNSYSEESIHGAQVFYYTHSEAGKKAAEIMQKELLSVDPENTRQAKANDTYYLLKRTEVPTIIVECGFLSNYEEAEKLIDPEYQKQLSQAIVKGIITCLEN
ncbi:MAG: N-acetylmuramoyl-L-alanine amidase [Dorea sp.]